MRTEIFIVKKPQWITIGAAIILTIGIYRFGNTIPPKGKPGPAPAQNMANHGQTEVNAISIDTLLALGKKNLTKEQVLRLNTLENSISRGDVKEQQIKVFHQLGHFWGDSAGIFELYAWYEAEASRLENSEKTLTFAARLFLDNLQQDDVAERRQWKALQAKDLFERSLKINPDNDSAKVGLGACYLFGSISSNPMEGLQKIKEVTEKDSTNSYAQITLAKGALMTGQYDKAITRLELVVRLHPDDLEAILLLADASERQGKKTNAIGWYEKSLPLVKQADMKKAIENRIAELKK